MSALSDRIAAGDVVILDGAMGTELERRGVPMNSVAWSATAMRTHPEVVREVHEDYIRAGADVIITNTFATARHLLARAGLGDEAAAFNRQAVELAMAARDRAAGGRDVWIAGSISSMVGKIDPSNRPAADEARASFTEQAEIFAEMGVDLVVLEMIRDTAVSPHLVAPAVASGLPVWLGFSVRRGDDGEVLLFSSLDSAPFDQVIDDYLADGVALATVMHSEVEDVTPGLEVLRRHWSGPLGAYPHSGTFVMPNWQFDDIIAPDAYLAEAQAWVANGVQVVGGCCGIGPDHIRLLKERLPATLSAAG